MYLVESFPLVHIHTSARVITLGSVTREEIYRFRHVNGCAAFACQQLETRSLTSTGGGILRAQMRASQSSGEIPNYCIFGFRVIHERFFDQSKSIASSFLLLYKSALKPLTQAKYSTSGVTESPFPPCNFTNPNRIGVYQIPARGKQRDTKSSVKTTS